MRCATLARVSLDRNSSIQRTEESNRNDAAKQRRYGKRYRAKIGESRFQVVAHFYYIRAFEPPVYARVSSHAQEMAMPRPADSQPSPYKVAVVPSTYVVPPAVSTMSVIAAVFFHMNPLTASYRDGPAPKTRCSFA